MQCIQGNGSGTNSCRVYISRNVRKHTIRTFSDVAANMFCMNLYQNQFGHVRHPANSRRYFRPKKTQISTVWPEYSLSRWVDCILGYLKWASEDSDQTVRMLGARPKFVVCACYILFEKKCHLAEDNGPTLRFVAFCLIVIIIIISIIIIIIIIIIICSK